MLLQPDGTFTCAQERELERHARVKYHTSAWRFPTNFCSPGTTIELTNLATSSVVPPFRSPRFLPCFTAPSSLVSGDLLRRHVTSKKALVITNDKVGPLYLDKTVKVTCVFGGKPLASPSSSSNSMAKVNSVFLRVPPTVETGHELPNIEALES